MFQPPRLSMMLFPAIVIIPVPQHRPIPPLGNPYSIGKLAIVPPRRIKLINSLIFACDNGPVARRLLVFVQPGKPNVIHGIFGVEAVPGHYYVTSNFM